MDNEDSTIEADSAEKSLFSWDNISAGLVLATIAILIVLKWPQAGFSIALTPVLGGPVGIIFYALLFGITRKVIRKLFDCLKSPRRAI